jgi:hypothetical protein
MEIPLPPLRLYLRSTQSCTLEYVTWWSVIKEGVWISGRVYWTLWYSERLYFTVHYYAKALAASVTSSLLLFRRGFQWHVFSFLCSRAVPGRPHSIAAYRSYSTVVFVCLGDNVMITESSPSNGRCLQNRFLVSAALAANMLYFSLLKAARPEHTTGVLSLVLFRWPCLCFRFGRIQFLHNE